MGQENIVDMNHFIHENICFGRAILAWRADAPRFLSRKKRRKM